MWKRVWGALDSLLSVVGFATFVLLGVRYWRHLPLWPYSQAPAAVVVAAPGAAAPGVVAAPPRALAPIAPLGESANAILGQPDSTAVAQPTEAAVSAPASAAVAPVLKQAHEWDREISVTVNASRYVKSLADLAPAPASLPDAARRELRAAQDLAKGSEMLLVCNVTVEYSGAEEVTLDQAGFRLVSPEREVFLAVPVPFSTRDLQPLRATLLAHGSAKGDLVFAVKRGVQPDEITYNPS